MAVTETRCVIYPGHKDKARRARLVEVAPGLSAMSPVFVSASVDGLALVARVIAEPSGGDRAGRFVCAELTVSVVAGGPMVTNEALRSVTVGTLTGAAARFAMRPEQGAHVPALPDGETVARLRRDGPTDDTLRLVALLYRLATVTGEPPTGGVEKTLDIPRSTAGRWVAMARDRGFLGATEGQGKVGG